VSRHHTPTRVRVRSSALASFESLEEEIEDRVATEMPGAVMLCGIYGSELDCRVRRSRTQGAERVHLLWEGVRANKLMRLIAKRHGPARKWL